MDDLVQELHDVLDGGIDQFDESVQGSQRAMYAKLLELTKELDVTNGKIKPSVKNLRLIRQIKTELEKAILNDKYLKSVDTYLKAFDKAQEIQKQYYTSLDAEFQTGQIFTELRNQAVLSVSNLLTEQGLSANVTSKVEDLLRQNILSGSSYADMQESMRTFLMNDENGDGALARYSKQITTDAIYTYAANYTQLAVDDLGMEWFVYTGNLIQTSRPFCTAMIDQSGDCTKFIHISEFPELLKGHVCAVDVSLNKKTGLPDGFRADTSTANFISYRGGYNCRHKLMAVSDAIVPQKYWDKIGRKKPVYK